MWGARGLSVCSKHQAGPAGELRSRGEGERAQGAGQTEGPCFCFEGSANVHVNAESVACVPALVTSCLCQPQGRG